MKANHAGWRPVRREQLVFDPRHDPFALGAKLPEPTRCLACGAVFARGRWRWGLTRADAHETLCPACRRISDDMPAGYVSLSGRFVAPHADEIIARMRNVESREKAEHPLERLMAIGRAPGGMLVKTTSIHLARAIGEALEDAYKGDLQFHYNDDEWLLRVQWSRD
jgi:hypothetical protein